MTTGALSTRDETKPLILLGAVGAGILLNRFLEEGAGWLIWTVEIGVFFVILAVMLPVEIRDVSRAFRKRRATALALFVNFIFIPAFAWALGWLLLRHQPDAWAGVILYTLTPCIGWYLIFIDVAEGDMPWGIALLPWNIILQVALMPVYLYLLVGRVLPLDVGALARSVILYLLLPFALSHAIQKWVVSRRGRDYFLGPFRHALGEVKLWALVAVITSMFASQRALTLAGAGRSLWIMAVIGLFFVALFAFALILGWVGRLSYEETATLVFTTTARNSEAVIAIAIAAFPGRPWLYLAIILGPIVELPALLFLSRLLLALRGRLWHSTAMRTAAAAGGEA